MNPFSLLWTEIVARPMFNMLIILLAVFGGNLGLAVIGLTLIVRLLLVKNAMAASNMQKDMADLQPKMQEIQEKYKDQPEKMSAEMMSLMKKSGGGPLKGCMTMLIQIPVFIGLYRTVQEIAIGKSPTEIYSFLQFLHIDIQQIDANFLGTDLLKAGNIVYAGFAAVLMYLQMQMMQLIKPNQAAKIPGMDAAAMPDMGQMMKVMNVVLVVMMGGFVLQSPAAVGLYIITTTLFGVLQQARQYRLLLKAKRDVLRGKPEIISG